ncbi:hypothetical protein PG991_001933 [Apiospora marii]|uniref:Uncharacterized protein n=1 Tax=Apiospora marii TaxID=335849 RepID=A0ABR1SNG2_9PEZI
MQSVHGLYKSAVRYKGRSLSKYPDYYGWKTPFDSSDKPFSAKGKAEDPVSTEDEKPATKKSRQVSKTAVNKESEGVKSTTK